jgi:uncharacterized protein YndB with AHSA1/START domain
MTNATITPNYGISGHDTIVSEIDIAAPMERVFRAISDEKEILRRSPELAAYELDPRVGGKWRLELHMPKPHHGVATVRHDGEILEFDPPRLLVYTWTANFHKNPAHVSIVRWELTAADSGTHVKVTHSGLAAEPGAAKDYAGGWPGVLDMLKKFVEQ